MYQDTILKYNHLKQAHTDTIYNIFEKNFLSDSKCFGEFLCQTCCEIRNCKWVKKSKN